MHVTLIVFYIAYIIKLILEEAGYPVVFSTHTWHTKGLSQGHETPVQWAEE